MEGYLAVIQLFAGTFAPQNWAFCAGQTLGINQNAALFALIGTTYGGDGSTTFKLPDLRGRIPIGAGAGGPGVSNYVLGQVGGNETISLNSSQMPVHTHTATSVLTAEGDAASSSIAQDNMLAVANIYTPSTGSDNQIMSNQSITTTVAAAGQGLPFNVLNPYLAINYIICLQGIFPSRN